MSLPALPLLLYAEPVWSPSPRKVMIYLAEKQLPSTVVKLVPHLDEEASKAYPKITGKAATKFMGPTVPKLAIPKAAGTQSTTNQDNYIWLVESAAIIEYLEDLCDAHPELSPVPSLRVGDDLVRRSLIRAALVCSEAVWTMLGATLLLGSQMYNDAVGSDARNIPSARQVAAWGRRTTLVKVDEILSQVTDFEGIEQNVIAAANIADITLFGTLDFYRVCHGIDPSRDYPNMKRFIEAWGKRKNGQAGVPEGGYSEMVTAFRHGFKEEVWPKATFD